MEDQSNVLAVELKTYRANVESWSDHIGEYVLIKGESVVGFYSSYGDAVQSGYSEFDLEPFLVKQVSVIEHVHFIPPLMRSEDGAFHTAN